MFFIGYTPRLRHSVGVLAKEGGASQAVDRAISKEEAIVSSGFIQIWSCELDLPTRLCRLAAMPREPWMERQGQRPTTGG